MFSDYAINQRMSSELKGSRTNPRSLVLTGGINEWAGSGKEYTDLMDGYDISRYSSSWKSECVSSSSVAESTDAANHSANVWNRVQGSDRRHDFLR